MPKKKKSAVKSAKAPSIPTIIKRDGRIVPFDLEKIVNAVWKGSKQIYFSVDTKNKIK
jgi:transcriptional regulator NrdR family protein